MYARLELPWPAPNRHANLAIPSRIRDLNVPNGTSSFSATQKREGRPDLAPSSPSEITIWVGGCQKEGVRQVPTTRRLGSTAQCVDRPAPGHHRDPRSGGTAILFKADRLAPHLEKDLLGDLGCQVAVEDDLPRVPNTRSAVASYNWLNA